ncbi:MAG: hypothetical protein FK734_10805 [Asgard group archaeon]|nr:hypothetical protein [Asgard group archaeon]
MRLRKVLLAIALSILAILPISFVSADIIIQNNEVAVIIGIDDAYYSAADSDGIQNDVIIDFSLEVLSTKFTYKTTCNFYICICLTLPSGTFYSYLYIVTSKLNIYVTPTAYLYNHATEEGWYRVEIIGLIYYTNTPVYDIGSEIFDFDPPGSTSGTDPLSCEIYI